MNPDDPLISRRRLLQIAGAGGATIALATACGTDSDPTSPEAASAPEATPRCVLTPEAVEGPFYTDVNLVRQDISEGRPGAPLELRLRVVSADSCEPIPDASVDVWHADAGGLYSAFTGQGDDRGVDTTGETFLRGVQNTNAEGLAVLRTIYPGWYMGRTTHIHIKIHFMDRTRVTSQLYFPDDVTAEVYALDAYAERGPKDTSNADDGFGAEDAGLVMSLALAGEGYLATHTIGIGAA